MDGMRVIAVPIGYLSLYVFTITLNDSPMSASPLSESKRVRCKEGHVSRMGTCFFAHNTARRNCSWWISLCCQMRNIFGMCLLGETLQLGWKHTDTAECPRS